MVRPATEKGRLYPRYESEIDILMLESRIFRRWDLGLNVWNSIILDLDLTGIPVSIEILFPKAILVGDIDHDMPILAPPGDLMFTPEAIAQSSFDIPVRARANRAFTTVALEIGDAKADRLVGLSNTCVAMIADGHLVGFAIKLPG
jgi:hypothetical protein